MRALIRFAKKRTSRTGSQKRFVGKGPHFLSEGRDTAIE
jgi:hypothetical protein